MNDNEYEIIRFNSTLVQLKVKNPPAVCDSCACFNSTLVQLKAHKRYLMRELYARFNSTLVQLKGSREHTPKVKSK